MWEIITGQTFTDLLKYSWADFSGSVLFNGPVSTLEGRCDPVISIVN
jgi:hypothetical protein